MASVTLTANSNKWGSGLNLTTVFSWEESGYEDTVTVTVKTVMTLKKGYGLSSKPPVSIRVLQGTTNIQTITNTTRVSHSNTADTTAYTLINTTFTLSRGYDYYFEMDYSDAWINHGTINIGTTPQQGYAYIPEASDPNVTCAINSVTRTGVDADTQDVTVSISYASEVTAPFELTIEAQASGGTMVLADVSETTEACKSGTYSTTLSGLDKSVAYNIVCSVEQRGINKTASTTVAAWQAPIISAVEVIECTYYSLAVRVQATSPQNDTLKYTYHIFPNYNDDGTWVNDSSSTECRFVGLDSARHYYIQVHVTDTQKSSTAYTLSGVFTNPAPVSALTIPVRKVVANGWLCGEGKLYYCATNNEPPRAVKSAAVIKDGAVVTIGT